MNSCCSDVGKNIAKGEEEEVKEEGKMKEDEEGKIKEEEEMELKGRREERRGIRDRREEPRRGGEKEIREYKENR